MAKTFLTEWARGRVEPEIKDAVSEIMRETDRSESYVVRAALRAYPPIKAKLREAQ